MLTSLHIGPNGRLGNQMFQYAALVGAATMRGYDWALHDNEDLRLREAFKLPNAKTLSQEQKNKIKFQYKEPSFYFRTNVFMIEDFTDLYGFFQSPLYFQHCFNIVREEFEFKDEIETEALRQVSKYSAGIPTCSIHIRRTDYLNSPDYHPACSLEYYNSAKDLVMRSANGNIKFLLFGDDYEWIKDNLLDENSVIVSGNSGALDMCLMSKCNAHIIANSSFSWWAAALGNINSVIVPNQWFGPAGPGNWDTVYFENWLRL